MGLHDLESKSKASKVCFSVFQLFVFPQLSLVSAAKNTCDKLHAAWKAAMDNQSIVNTRNLAPNVHFFFYLRNDKTKRHIKYKSTVAQEAELAFPFPQAPIQPATETLEAQYSKWHFDLAFFLLPTGMSN